MRKVMGLGLISTLALAFPALASHHEHEAEIESAMAAGPMEISGEATIKLHDDTVVREGTNGWTCFPDVAAEGDEEGETARCYNAAWAAFAEAYKTDENAVAPAGALTYMLSADNPHIMVLMPGADAVASLPTEAGHGTYAMDVGGARQHLMIPAGGSD